MENINEIALRILQRAGSLDKAIREAEVMMYTSHTSWGKHKYERVIKYLTEKKLNEDLDCYR